MPSLYGIKYSNRDFSDKYYWGKNQFNSSFPIALACYMRDREIPANYISQQKNCKTKISPLSFDKVFGTSKANSSLKFLFETQYSPFEILVEDSLEKIDVVIIDNDTQQPIRPLEIKLTTLPDDCTSILPEKYYGSEIVVRSATMRYIAMSMATSCIKEHKQVWEILHPACGKIRYWDSVHEMSSVRKNVFDALESFFATFSHKQKPFLLQPVWKTIGKEARLNENCLDIFVWSDFAVSRLFMDTLTEESHQDKISRPQRCALRLARFLYEFSKSAKVFQQPIYDGMTFDTQNDKEFSVSGRKTNPYMRCARLIKPKIQKNEIRNIVLDGGQKWLSPERRFDSILFFSKDIFDE